MSTALVMVAAVLLDAWLGEPRRAHPLVAFGRFAQWLEGQLHADRRLSGVIAWCFAVLPWVVITALITMFLKTLIWPLRAMFEALVLYLVIGHRSLGEHAGAVADALKQNELDSARVAVSRMVSRDTATLDALQVAAAATESVLENGNDAVFGALFWFAVLGAPGAVLFRLSNTLDAMWGYRSERYGRFGWAAARFDDALNLVHARLTALTYALSGHFACALRCWRTQARTCKSPNAGPVMAAGAGAIGVQLGGPASYHGRWEQRPLLGNGEAAGAESVERAVRLLRRGVFAWLGVALVISLVLRWAAHA